MQGILGKKLGMTRIFTAEGQSVPVTVIQAGPCVVTALRTNEKNGYEAIQLGFEEVKKVKKVIKPVKGQFTKINVQPMKNLKEIRGANPSEYKVGQQLNVDIFKEGDKVDVVGISIGKGFAGAMKRHNFSGGGNSHGSTVHRRPCSAGATDAARSFKGRRNPGHMGAKQRTVQALEVIKVDKDKNLLLIKGSVPGARNSLITVYNTLKVRKKRKPKILGTQTK
jgi:large subunit ribosomal protein L3